MDLLRCIIVDDEEGAHRVLEHFIGQVRYLEMAGSFYTALDAMEYIYQNNIDLVFLDINMPGLSGLEMLGAMSSRPFVVLTTAYKEYALESYQYDVVDYLVKPFDFKRFLSSVDKVMNRMGTKQIAPQESITTDYLVLKVDGAMLKLKFEQILYTQSYGNYVKFFTADGMRLSQITTAEVENKLNPKYFVRIHKSYIVAIKEVSTVSGGEAILFNGTRLPVGNLYRKTLLDSL
ncbi:response regulator transcription factor [Pedobacter riviphilus]|uniref:Response regulator transcription factor n=1 Tax=Pedobacter riviphilus TaxID=2766984 RepID=A0ABX6TQ27_9SPHI|nr:MULTISPECIES: LytTR family DNA-binding domain-containing protein [Pedobacter]NII83226.1 DNA-binding LytR/AlgR family response regulator [Pedobacter sp. SG908]QNR86814.1 response regulator transcription factor [Pedobacter riviphilus]